MESNEEALLLEMENVKQAEFELEKEAAYSRVYYYYLYYLNELRANSTPGLCECFGTDLYMK